MIQSQIEEKAHGLRFNSIPELCFTGENSLSKVCTAVKEASATTESCLEEIKAGSQLLERRVRESKEIAQLDVEFCEMKDTVDRVMDPTWLCEQGPSPERRMKKYEKLEDHALKVLKICMRLKGKDEQRE